MFCYFNDGMSGKCVDADYKPQPGEAVYDDIQTPEVLAERFAGYKAAADKEEALKLIQELEASITSRRIREAVLGQDKGWLANIEAQIEILRTEINA